MLSAIAKESSYRILADREGVEVDRINDSNNKGNLVLSLRVRNNTSKPIKLYSFVVAEFYLPVEFGAFQVLEHNWLQCSDVLRKSILDMTLKKTYALSRDQNEFSFRKEYGYVKDSIVSEWFTLIKGLSRDLFIGAVTTADQFSQIFVKHVDGRVLVRVTCQYDGLDVKPGEVVKSEKIFFSLGKEDKIKKDFAHTLAKYMHVKNVSRPIRAMCNSYYWNGNFITDEIINKELDVLENLPEKINLDYFQLDAGYTKYFGDWLDYGERFPSGFVDIVARIKKLGYKPGIWISPFSINPGTKLHDEHKSWLVHDDDREHFEGRATSPVDKLNNYLALEVLDVTKNEVQGYLAEVLKHFKDLGFVFYKLDFMYPLCLTNSYSKKVTRARALRSGLELIRKVIGDDCSILSGIVQLSSIVGIADHVRSGLDTLNPFVSNIPGVNTLVDEYMLTKNMNEVKERLFLNGIVWRSDPDVLVFRDNTGINQNLINKHKKFTRENGLSMWIGDSLAQLDRSQLVKVVDYFNKD